MAGGRPTKRTPEAREQILDALAKGCPLHVAAAAGGMTYQSLNEWRKSDVEFSEALENAEGTAQQALLHRIRVAAETGTVITKRDGEIIEYPGAWQAAAWLLERRWPTAYGRREKVEMSGPDGGPIQVLQGLNDHERRALKDAIDRELKARQPA